MKDNLKKTSSFRFVKMVLDINSIDFESCTDIITINKL